MNENNELAPREQGVMVGTRPQHDVDCDCDEGCCEERPMDRYETGVEYNRPTGLKRPSKYEFRDFSVKGLNYGYIVNVGCHSFAIETKERLANVLADYILDPDKMERIWWENKTV